MRVMVIGRGPIAQAIIAELKDSDHIRTEEGAEYKSADAIVWARGNDYENCVEKLSHAMSCAPEARFVVITSEHGSIATTNPAYRTYHAVKAGQKMLCQSFVAAGGKCVDVSPAFVRTDNMDRRINKDRRYAAEVAGMCNDEYPISPRDVAKAVIFAIDNCGQISGTTIKVSAGWMNGGIY